MPLLRRRQGRLSAHSRNRDRNNPYKGSKMLNQPHLGHRRTSRGSSHEFSRSFHRRTADEGRELLLRAVAEPAVDPL